MQVSCTVCCMLKKLEVSISSYSKVTMNRTIELFLITLYAGVSYPGESIKKSAKAWLPGVWYPDKSSSQGYHTAQSPSPWGMIPRGVSLTRVSYPGESFGGIFHIISLGLWVKLNPVRYPVESVSPGYDTRGVNLAWVSDPKESLKTPGSQQPLL